MLITEKEELKKHNWWKIGGPAEYFCQPKNSEELKKALQWAKSQQKKWTVLGRGTNVLISDLGVKGLVISTAQLQSCEIKKSSEVLFVTCGAGLLKSQLMKIFKSHKLAPALFLSGIPGDVGGGVVMNAGVSRPVQPYEFSQIVSSFKVMNSESSKTYLNKDINWSYRQSVGWQRGVIYEVELAWSLSEELDLHTKLKAELQNRRASQPLDKASCGSVFKNPESHLAGQLIEKAGLKGLKQGSAQVSTKHANFIVNTGQARATDIHDLIQTIQKKVFEKFSVKLETEVHYMGLWDFD